jgi:hypothetical protein
MPSILPCMCSRFCQADSTCDHLPRFQIYLDAHHPQIHRSAEACASHLGDVVVTMTAWAREQRLANADLTVMTMSPPPRESHLRRQASPSYVQTSGIVFSVIHLHDQGAMSATWEPSSKPACSGRQASFTKGPLYRPLTVEELECSPMQSFLEG